MTAAARRSYRPLKWFLRGIASLVVLFGLAVAALWAMTPNDLRPRDWQKVRDGMTHAEVVAALGQAPALEWEVTEEIIATSWLPPVKARPDRAETYESKHAVVVVYYRSGRVVGENGAWQEPGEPLWAKMRRWLEGDFEPSL